ncbi:type II toxin-antitoxin system RelE/ParE family toxin [uncultured Pseudacidovorax sp.]|uniref:type II toxin-antitoxin system RelE/ParE family toxin n=1 Tax=uncultured Pseudacidovorax sp. TaxID=679313 RepID=UPI0025F97BD6|nr:type II toxin-antitoxin system RelE/ParE family toxin [uncultured Pseudacidovorax sp.]
MQFEVHLEKPAQHDLRMAFEWYETKQTGLGAELLRSVAALVELLSRDPQRFRHGPGAYRSAKLRRFPYAMHYRIEGQHVHVLACVHFRQSPERWPGA